MSKGLLRGCLVVLALFSLPVFCPHLWADTLYLKNGRAMEGIIKSQDESGVDLEIFGGVVRFRKTEIERIEKANQETSDAIRRKWERKRTDTITKAKEDRLRRELEPRQVEISRVSGHIVVDTLINKKTKVSLIMDTGATYVVLSSSAAKRLGLNLNDEDTDTIELILADASKVSAKRVILDSVSTQGVETENVAAAILPEGVVDAGLNDGLLGMSFLKNFNFKVDQKNNKLILEKLQ